MTTVANPSFTTKRSTNADQFPYRLLSVLMDHRKSLGLGPHHVLVTYALARRGMKSWPSYKTLVHDTGLSERAIRDAITQLEKLRLLSVARRKGQGSTYDLAPLRKRLEGLRQDMPETPAPHARVPRHHMPPEVEKTEVDNEAAPPVSTSRDGKPMTPNQRSFLSDICNELGWTYPGDHLTSAEASNMLTVAERERDRRATVDRDGEDFREVERQLLRRRHEAIQREMREGETQHVQ